ncbi:YncE family protein [Streptomyces europaeiscabiei]|uniref:YncE family protein n=1 Tax=Streptomyces europaeiscabiei TaxID=146819 RepID=UPI0038F66A25
MDHRQPVLALRNEVGAASDCNIGHIGDEWLMPQEDTQELTAISLEWEPWRIAFDPDGRRAYVATSNAGSEGGSKGRVSVIDTAAEAVVADIDLGTLFLGILGGDLAVTSDGRHLYVTGAREVTVIELTTNQVATRISLSEGLTLATGVAIAPDGSRAFVLAQGGGDAGAMCVIDTASQSIIHRIGLSFEPFGVELSPDGKRAYVSHLGDSGMLIDLATQNVEVLPFPFEGRFWMAITPDGKRAYVGRDHNDDLWVTELTTHSVTAVVPTMRNIGDVTITPDGGLVYVSQGGGHGDEPNVMVVDTDTEELTCCPVSWFNAQPRGMAITPDGKHAYVTDSRHRKVFVVPVPEARSVPG